MKDSVSAASKFGRGLHSAASGIIQGSEVKRSRWNLPLGRRAGVDGEENNQSDNKETERRARREAGGDRLPDDCQFLLLWETSSGFWESILLFWQFVNIVRGVACDLWDTRFLETFSRCF